MASKITSSPVTEEPKTDPNETDERPLMPQKLLQAAIDGNNTDLKQLLGLDDEEQDQPPHTKVSVEDVTPMEPSDCLRSIAGMKDTILHILSANGQKNLLFRICTKNSSLLNACNARNETPFHHAARFGHIDTILELIHSAKLVFGDERLKELLRKKNYLGETALHEAARHGHRVVVLTLMEEDLELAGLVNNDSVSPLYLATARASLVMVQNMVAKMLNHQITPDFYAGPKNLTALHAAVLQYPELTREVLQLCPEQMSKGTDETRRILHLVASTGNHKIAKLLLDRDRSLAYIRDSHGSFPVHTAVRMGHVKMIVLLLQRCPDSGQLLDGNGRNFLHIAIEVNKSFIILKLLKNSKNKLSYSHWKKMFNKMINTMDNKGNTPIHLAAEHGNISKFATFLLGGNEWDMTLQNKEGLTAFDISVIHLRKSAGKTKSTDMLDEFYFQNGGARFSTGLFQYYTKDQMPETELFRASIQDRILETDTRGAKGSSHSVLAKAQLVGLGSVLIATVTFAGIFTPPGDTNYQDTNQLGKFSLKAFVLADCLAFFFSMLSTMVLVYSSNDENPDSMGSYISMSMNIFTIAAKCMVVALVFGLYMAVPQIANTVMVVLVLFLVFTVVQNPVSFIQRIKGFNLKRQLLKHIPDGASGVKPKYTRDFYIIIHLVYKLYVPAIAPFFAVILLSLI